MYQKEELDQKIEKKDFQYQDILGDIVISIPKVEEQAKEYGHSFERELSYMLVHGFYHLMGYDHIEEEDKKQMRKKEEKILETLNISKITREKKGVQMEKRWSKNFNSHISGFNYCSRCGIGI